MKTLIEAYDCFQRKFSFVMELNTVSNCKTEASAKTLLQYYSDDLEESLPEEMIHFSTLIQQHHFNRECKEFQMFKFINENEFMHAFPKVSVIFRPVPLSDDFKFLGRALKFSSKKSKESTALIYGPKKIEFLCSTLH